MGLDLWAHWKDDPRAEPVCVVRPNRPRCRGIPHPSYKLEDNMQNLLKRLWQDEQGQDIVEYALLVVLVALVAVAALQTLGTTIQSVFTNATTAVST
jgi:pilus assembly protein Flp/PilA